MCIKSENDMILMVTLHFRPWHWFSKSSLRLGHWEWRWTAVGDMFSCSSFFIVVRYSSLVRQFKLFHLLSEWWQWNAWSVTSLSIGNAVKLNIFNGFQHFLMCVTSLFPRSDFFARTCKDVWTKDLSIHIKLDTFTDVRIQRIVFYNQLLSFSCDR